MHYVNLSISRVYVRMRKFNIMEQMNSNTLDETEKLCSVFIGFALVCLYLIVIEAGFFALRHPLFYFACIVNKR